MKKFLVLLFTVFSVLGFQLSVKADDSSLVVSFDKLEFTIDDYLFNHVEVDYFTNGLTEVAIVTDSETGELVEKIELIPYSNENVLTRGIYRQAASPQRVVPHTLRRTFVVGGTTLRLDIQIQLYSSGSFRQINAINNRYLSIITHVSPMYIEGQAVSVWSPVGFPTTQVHYSVSGTLVSKISTSLSSSLGVTLQQHGFTLGGSLGQELFYRLPFNQNGSISVYGSR